MTVANDTKIPPILISVAEIYERIVFSFPWMSDEIT
jgi:hypothetical protein